MDTEQSCSYNGLEQQYCVHLAEYGARNPGELIHLGTRKDGTEVILWLCKLCWDQVEGIMLHGIVAQAIERLAREDALPGVIAASVAAPSDPAIEDTVLRQLLRDHGGIVGRQVLPASLAAAVTRAIEAGWLQSSANTESYYALELAWKRSDGPRSA